MEIIKKILTALANADKGAPLTLTLSAGLYAEHAIKDVADNANGCTITCRLLTAGSVQVTILLPPTARNARQQIGTLLNQFLIATLTRRQELEPR